MGNCKDVMLIQEIDLKRSYWNLMNFSLRRFQSMNWSSGQNHVALCVSLCGILYVLLLLVNHGEPGQPPAQLWRNLPTKIGCSLGKFGADGFVGGGASGFRQGKRCSKCGVNTWFLGKGPNFRTENGNACKHMKILLPTTSNTSTHTTG